jgi:hypothetical protein
VINKACNLDLLKHHLNKDFGQDYHIVQYADDTLIILPSDARQLFNLRGLLRNFANSTRLNVNYSKSFLILINLENDQAQHLARTNGCQVGLNRLLSYQGRQILVNSVLLTLPTFYMCALKISTSIFDQADKCRKHCLWNMVDINRKEGYLLAWEKATMPKNQGGLDVINLRAHNTAP